MLAAHEARTGWTEPAAPGVGAYRGSAGRRTRRPAGFDQIRGRLVEHRPAGRSTRERAVADGHPP